MDIMDSRKNKLLSNIAHSLTKLVHMGHLNEAEVQAINQIIGKEKLPVADQAHSKECTSWPFEQISSNLNYDTAVMNSGGHQQSTANNVGFNQTHLTNDLEGLVFSPKPPSSSSDDEDGGAPLTPEPFKTLAKTGPWGKPIKLTNQPVEGDLVGGKAPPLGSQNKGFTMLSKMGWSSGTGLGAKRQGVTDPVNIYMKSSKQGLGKTVNFQLGEPIVDSVPTEKASSDWDQSLTTEEFHRKTQENKREWRKMRYAMAHAKK